MKRAHHTCVTDLMGPDTTKSCYDNTPCDRSKPAPRSEKCKVMLESIEDRNLLFGKYDKVVIDETPCFKTRGDHGWCYTKSVNSHSNKKNIVHRDYCYFHFAEKKLQQLGLLCKKLWLQREGSFTNFRGNLRKEHPLRFFTMNTTLIKTIDFFNL